MAKQPSKNGALPPIGIGKLVRRAHMAFSREFRDRLRAHDVGFGEFVHLERLWSEDGLNQTELSRRVGIENASSTTVLDTLEKRRYIRRERDARDRRNIRVFLTPSGRKLQSKLLACAETVNLIARRGMSRKDVLIFFSLMEVIVSNLESTESFQSRQKRGRE
jgi:DNA-binding MarR family transcriptional regulator